MAQGRGSTYEWIGWRRLYRLPRLTPLLVRCSSGSIVGRIETVHDGILELKGIEEDHRILFAGFDQARVLSGLWDPTAYAGPPLIVKRGVDQADWRGEVVEQRGRKVTVRTIDGAEIVSESDLAWPDSETPPLPPVKPGRVSDDPVVEQINQAAYEAAKGA